MEEKNVVETPKNIVTYTWLKNNGKIQTIKYERKKLIDENTIDSMKSDLKNGQKVKDVCNKYKLSRQTVKKYTNYKSIGKKIIIDN